MRVRKKINFTELCLYLLLAFATLFLFFIGNNGEPFGLALAYATASAGISPLWCATFYLISALPTFETTLFFLYLGQAVLLFLGFILQNRLRKSDFLKSGLLPMLCLSLALGSYVAFAPFQPYNLPFLPILENAISQKIVVCLLLFLLSAVFSVAMKGLLKKFLRCRLRSDELLFISLLFAFIGVGACRLFSVNAYMGIAFFAILLFAYVTKDSSALILAFVLSLPPYLIANLSPERFFFYGVAVVLFAKYGRLSACLALLTVFFFYGYIDGLYTYPTEELINSLLSVMIPIVLFLLLPTPLVRELENKLVFYREKHLSRIAINRNRSAIGEQLFELSTLFREIQSTFSSLGTSEAEEGAKTYMVNSVCEQVCKQCSNYPFCEKQQGISSLTQLIEVGCLKGKVNLIDIPKTLADVCAKQTDLLYAVNQRLGDYKKYMTEAENAASGRAMLASQAQGVSEILKNLALEQSEPLHIYTDKERALNVALLGVGIVCSEVLVFGEEDNLTLSLITFGNADVKKIAAVATHLFDMPMMISQRLTLSYDKFCCILRKKPRFDAAFGVATVTKKGEDASGDTHSVIKIDERKFMVALSDGMGSGEYAKRISESTVSLLESFYRAKMPSSLILNTINKLLTFGKEESFTCVDIAIVDLDSGFADVVKIGSPVGFILSGNTVKVLESTSLPLGILDSLRPDTSSYELLENDVLLFLSDGITDAFGSTTDLFNVLRSVPLRNPQELTDGILQQALQAYGGQAKDDMTAVAVRLFKNKAES